MILENTVDEKLTFNDHVGNVVRSCNNNMRAIRHIRPFVFRNIVNTIARSVINSWLHYCNAVLYGVAEYNIQRLQRAQNLAE